MARDTSRDAEEAQLAVLRRLGPSERVRIAVEMSEDARRIAIDAERRRHPELDELEARWLVLRRMWSSPKE
ncbi:MAG TPA: hypothetical protein VGH28_29640 [Polyangiaceae bacterium]